MASGQSDPDEVNMNAADADKENEAKGKPEVKRSSVSRTRKLPEAPKLHSSKMAKIGFVITILFIIDVLAAFSISAFLLPQYMKALKEKKKVSKPFYIGVVSSLMVGWLPSCIFILCHAKASRGLVLFIFIFHLLVTTTTAGFLALIEGDLYILAVMCPLLVFRVVIWISLIFYEKKRNLVDDVDADIGRDEQRRFAQAVIDSRPPYAPSHPAIVPES